MKTKTQIILHTSALDALYEIQKCRQAIKDCQSNMVEIEKNIFFGKIVKQHFEDQYTIALNKHRALLKDWKEHYASIMRTLVEPLIPSL